MYERWRRYGFRLPTLISGLILTFAFAPWNLYPLIWISLVPWLYGLTRCKSPREAVIQGLWLGILMSLGNFYWVAYTLHEFGQLPWIVAIVGLGLFTLICQPQFALFAPIWIATRTRLHDRGGSAPARWKKPGFVLATALAYAGLDWILPKLFVDTLGHAFYAAPTVRQIADIGGAWMLTFVVFLANETLLEVILDLQAPAYAGGETRLRRLHRNLPIYMASSAVFLAAIVYGKLREDWLNQYYSRPEIREAPRARLSVIQANIGDFDKIASESGVRGAADRVVSTYLGLSQNALKEIPAPDALIWPETSYPSTFRTPITTSELEREKRIEAMVRDSKTPLWFGGYDRQGTKDFNSFFFLGPNLEMQVYHKNILLLFGEYIPGMESIRWLKEMFPQIGNFGRGPGPETLSLPTANSKLGALRASPMICYEALFPSFAIEGARKGSQLLLNITNDSWFGPFSEPFSHLSLTTFRSIETRLPQLRATNTGVSALILPTGEISRQGPIFRPMILHADVQLAPSPWTLMKAWGDWFGTVALLLGLVPLSALLWRARARPA